MSVAALGAVVLVLSEFGDGAGGGAVVSAGAFGVVVVALVLSEFGDGAGVEVVVPGGVLGLAWGDVAVMVGAGPDGLAVAGGIVLTRVVGVSVGAVPVAVALDPEAGAFVAVMVNPLGNTAGGLDGTVPDALGVVAGLVAAERVDGLLDVAA
ncbi:MAG TPA: hypothetical protein VLC49_13870 [Solirubrobacteraceae bacterium]|nr:hypothetical protein [Solirubrobacteraceae bacterium]